MSPLSQVIETCDKGASQQFHYYFSMKDNTHNIVGIIPAAGNASRISPIPCSKEIFPVGFEGSGEQQIKVAASYLLESFSEAGTDQIYMVTRKGKWDILQFLGTGLQPDYTLSYIVTDPTPGTHYTIDLTYRFVRDKMVLLGFPDILFTPKNAFVQLLNKQKQTAADVVLGLFKATNHRKADMVDFDDQGRIRNIVIKPEQTSLIYTWTIAVWTPVFSNYLHKIVTDMDIGKSPVSGQNEEIFIGDIIQAAIQQGMNVESVLFPDGKFLDIGTVPDLKRVLQNKF